MAIDVAELTEEQIREQVRGWLRQHLPKDWVETIESNDPEKMKVFRGGGGMAAMIGFDTGAGGLFGLNVQQFLDDLAESGYAAATWPKPYGAGLSPVQARVVNEELGRYRAPRPFNIIGIGMGGPTLLQWGSDELKERLIRPMLANREIWCQLFSEPGHGSDVAGLSTRAVRAGDEWIVNGQKVWTTFAHMSKWGMLVARTNPDIQKHQGLSYFIVDMKAPGVTVRPLKQITGDAEFNEVFFEDVRIPDSYRVGPEGSGWQVATTTLMNERVALGSGTTAGMPESLGIGPVDGVIERYKPLLRENKALRDETMKLWCDNAAQRLTGARAGLRRKSGAQPGPEGSIGKLAQAEFNQRLQILTMKLEGARGIAWDDPAQEMIVRPFLRSRANTIEGGTSEIMRNILGERVLGLPKDIDVSRDVPWKDVPRNAPSKK